MSIQAIFNRDIIDTKVRCAKVLDFAAQVRRENRKEFDFYSQFYFTILRYQNLSDDEIYGILQAKWSEFFEKYYN